MYLCNSLSPPNHIFLQFSKTFHTFILVSNKCIDKPLINPFPQQTTFKINMAKEEIAQFAATISTGVNNDSVILEIFNNLDLIISWSFENIR